MSKVISFRLNKDNPREAQALQVIKSWSAKGYSIRRVITQALLGLDSPDEEYLSKIGLKDLNETLTQVNQLLKQFGNKAYSPTVKQNEEEVKSGLSEDFVVSIKKTVKPGVKII